jgi:hypothetical protein
MQRHHTVATASVRKGMRQRFRGRGDVRMLVPVVTVARERCRVAGSAVIEGEVKGYQRVTAGHIGRIRRIIAWLGVGSAVPGEAVACERRGVARIAVTHR